MRILQNGNSVKSLPETLLKDMSKTNVMLETSFVFGNEAAHFDGQKVTFQRNILSQISV